MEEKINKVAAIIAKAQKVVVFTGAGISTESGIPDFRGPGGSGQNMIRMISPLINSWDPLPRARKCGSACAKAA